MEKVISLTKIKENGLRMDLVYAFTFTFAACEPADNQTLNGKLTLTSKAVMNFDKLGGTGEITFDFVADQTRKASPVTPSCSANWITDIELGTNNNVTFVVAPNEGDERSAQITLRAGQDNIHVMVMQDGGTAADTNFKATHLGGSYFGKFITDRGQTEGFNYFIILRDIVCVWCEIFVHICPPSLYCSFR